jgi:DNA-binding transcriptional LysR family regulator
MQWDDRIGRRLKLRDLHIFMTVAQQGSMGKAAKQLAVSQPVVSKAISDLEHTLNVQLVDRTAQGIEPTVYGKALLRNGTVVFDDLRRSVKEIEFLTDPTAGEVRIASSDMVNATFVPAVIDCLARKYPRLFFNVRAPRIDAFHSMVRERTVDLALAHVTRPLKEEDLQVELLYPDALFVVAGVDNKWVRRRKVQLAELLDEPWCLASAETVAGATIEQAFRDRGFAVPRHVATDSLPLWQAMVATGRVLAFATGTRLRFGGKQLALKAVRVDLCAPCGQVGIITLKNRTISPPAQLFIECAREMAKTLV